MRLSDLPTTSREAFDQALRLELHSRHGLPPREGHPPSAVEAKLFRALGAWLAKRETAQFEAIASAQERRARAHCAQFETASAETW